MTPLVGAGLGLAVSAALAALFGGSSTAKKKKPPPAPNPPVPPPPPPPPKPNDPESFGITLRNALASSWAAQYEMSKDAWLQTALGTMGISPPSVDVMAAARAVGQAFADPRPYWRNGRYDAHLLATPADISRVMQVLGYAPKGIAWGSHSGFTGNNFGNPTYAWREAFKSAQRAGGVTEDGIPGPETMGALSSLWFSAGKTVKPS